mgnify:CR=1 FL=1
MAIFQEFLYGKNRQSGFTLMEMLIVLFIIGALITIIMPNLTNAGVRAQHKACEANKKVILAQAEAYFLKNGHEYPDNVQELVDAGYLRETPYCPLEHEEATLTSYQLSKVDETLIVTCNHHDKP